MAIPSASSYQNNGDLPPDFEGETGIPPTDAAKPPISVHYVHPEQTRTHALDEFADTSTTTVCPVSRFVHSLQSQQAHQRHAIRNVETELEILQLEKMRLPLTRNETEYDNSYVCSSYSAYISYAAEELHLLKSQWSQRFFRTLIPLFSGLMKWGKINRTISLNNWLFSTNPFPNLDKTTLQAITQQLSVQNPHHSLSIRSLNQYTNGQVIEDLKSLGWLMLPARQVYLYPINGDWWKRNNVKNDLRLLRKTDLTLVRPEEHQEADFIDIERCFHKLYIEKHSQYNPEFSADYLYTLHQQNLLEFYSFRDSDGRIVSTSGIFTQHDVITMPVVGYDTDLPKSMGLYRLAIAQLLKITHERQQLLNLSSGAAHFKRHRGGRPEIEYTAFYCKHLPIEQKGLLHSLSFLLNRFAPKVFAENEI